MLKGWAVELGGCVKVGAAALIRVSGSVLAGAAWMLLQLDAGDRLA